MDGKKIQIQLTRSTIACPPWMRVIVKTLGLRKMQSKKIVTDCSSIRGMIKKVPHLVTVTEVKE